MCGGRNLEHFYENKSNLSGSLHGKKEKVIEIDIIDHKCHLLSASFWLSILCFDAHASMTTVGQKAENKQELLSTRDWK